jgi:hypothetical protein
MTPLHFTKKKFNNTRTVIDNITFDSKLESNRYLYLKNLEHQNLISGLVLQPPFLLQDKFTDNQGVNHRAINYIADFQYFDEVVQEVIVEDTKGMITDVFKIKKKLLLNKYPHLNFIEIIKGEF